METQRRYGRYTVEISHPEKILFPDAGLTKSDLIDYYERVADVMLPHVQGRIVTMRRFPDGLDGKSFYQKDVPDYFPSWIKTVAVKKEGGNLRQLVIENTATLVYLANQAVITPHVWPSRADRRHHPDRMILDLDPSGSDFALVRDAARALRQLLRQIGLMPFVMTTGSRGLHVVVPLDARAEFDTVRDFARRACALVAAEHPDHFTLEQRKSKRHGRVFLDFLRNAYAQHAVAPYGVRARPGAPVAAPVDWEELSHDDIRPDKYTIRNLFRRLARKEDPWKGIGQHARSLTEPARRIESAERQREKEEKTD